MLSTPATKEVVADAACGDACVNRNLGQVIQTGANRSTPGSTGMAVRSKPVPYTFLIGSPTIYPACGISESLRVGKK